MHAVGKKYDFVFKIRLNTKNTEVQNWNKLSGTNIPQDIAGRENGYLVLENGSNGVGLYLPEGNVEQKNCLPKSNMTYLENLSGMQVNGLRFVIDETMGIESVEKKEGNLIYFDFSGRRVCHLAHSFYILNGRKIFVK